MARPFLKARTSLGFFIACSPSLLDMRGHAILLAFASTLLSPTTADPIALAIVMPTESASLPLGRLKSSGPLDQQRSGVPTPRQVISEGTGKETCGFFRTGGGPAEPVCSGKTENGERTLCWRKPENGPSLLRRRLQDKIHPEPRVEYVADLYHGPATTVIINIVIVVFFAFGYVQAPDRVCETLRYPDDRYTLGVFDE
ncbi:hypothetical protein Landi51_03937 [Colletotrichum acutatum]